MQQGRSAADPADSAARCKANAAGRDATGGNSASRNAASRERSSGDASSWQHAAAVDSAGDETAAVGQGLRPGAFGPRPASKSAFFGEGCGQRNGVPVV
jgi:hypothetical protein